MPLSIDDLIEITLLESGQFIAGLDATLIDKNKFELLARREAYKYSQYKPLVKTLGGDLFNSKTFQTPPDIDIPETIIEIRRTALANLFIGGSRYGILPRSSWRYDKPTLWMSVESGTYQYTYTMKHEYNGDTKVFETLDISSNSFLRLVLGKFLIAVGRSRRAFTLNDIPIESDASEMVSEGNEIYDGAIEGLQNHSKYYLAIF